MPLKFTIAEVYTMACKGTLRVVVDEEGDIVRIDFRCKGRCEDGTRCTIQESKDKHGSTRQWCGCEETEPNDCRLVIYTPGPGVGGGPSQVLCAGRCEDDDDVCGPEPVVIHETKVLLSLHPLRIGTRYDFACECD